MRVNQKGFGLVEVMVGLGIGMLAMVVVMQVFSQSEAQKRTTTGGADAQNNGAMALFMIERDARMAGWGVDNKLFAGCQNAFTYCDGSAACGGAVGSINGFSLASISIGDGGTTTPDAITIRYFADPSIGNFRYASNTRLRSDMPEPSSELNVANTGGCNDGDMVLLTQGDRCTLMQATQVQDEALKVQHNPGKSGIYNPPASYQKSNNWPAYTQGAKLSCFAAPPGGAMFQRTYAVDSARRQLQFTDNANGGGSQDVVPEIMDLQAQYGIAPANSHAVNQWVDATGADWVAPTAVNRGRIMAVRIALVARSTQYEKPASGKACATTTQAMADKWSTWAKFNTTRFGGDWQCYRYKTFETVVPLRNSLWREIDAP